MASSQTQTKKDDKAAAATKAEGQAPAEQKPAALEEDDEFEDFPVDGASTATSSSSPVLFPAL